MTPRRAAVAAALLALVAHLPSLAGEFVYDDHRFVERNPSVEAVGNPARFFTDLSTTASPDAATRDIYRPLRTLTYAVVRATFGEGPRPLHALSLLLHAATTFTLALLLGRAGLLPWAALAGALAFGLHPVTVEVTSWVSSLGDAWFGLFGALSMLWYAGGSGSAALLALAAGLFSKEHAIILPVLWLAWDWAMRRERLAANALRLCLPGIAAVVAFLLWRRHLGAGIGQMPEPIGGSLLSALLTMLSAVGFYASTILFPSGPTFGARVIDQHSLTPPVILGAALLSLLVMGLFTKKPRIRLSCAWFLLALAPVSNLVAPLKIPTADRFLYLPLMGLAFAAGHLVSVEWVRPLAARGAWCALGLLGALSMERTRDWRDESSFVAAWRAAAPKSLELLWADAAVSAQEALAAMRAESFREAGERLKLAIANYERYLRNARPEERTRAHVELADLLFAAAVWHQRLDYEHDAGLLYQQALDNYLYASDLQQRGVGRVLEAEVVHVADRILESCVRLALPENPRLAPTIAAGVRAGQILERFRLGDPRDRFRGAQLLLVDGVRIRAERPAEARKRLDAALREFMKLEAEGIRGTFPRAQCLYYLATLLDAPAFDREGLHNARALFFQAAGESAELKSRALFLAARCFCTEAKLFGDAAAAEQGLRLLEEVEKIAESARLRAEIESERAGCASR